MPCDTYAFDAEDLEPRKLNMMMDAKENKDFLFQCILSWCFSAKRGLVQEQKFSSRTA